jgi:hypothetical protein
MIKEEKMIKSSQMFFRVFAVLLALCLAGEALARTYIRKSGSIIAEIDGNYLRQHGAIVLEFDGKYVRQHGSILLEFDGKYVRQKGSIVAEIDGRYVRKSGAIVWEIDPSGKIRRHGSIVYEVSDYNDSLELKRKVVAFLLLLAE